MRSRVPIKISREQAFRHCQFHMLSLQYFDKNRKRSKIIIHTVKYQLRWNLETDYVIRITQY